MSEPISTTGKSEIVYTDQKRVACDGPADGRHPRVFLTMGEENNVVCPYCSRVFEYQEA